MKNKKSSNLMYSIFNILVVFIIIQQIYFKNWKSIIPCIVALLLFTLPTIIEKKFKIKMSLCVKVLIYIFVFSTIILGEIENFYEKISYWDSMLHMLSGFIMGIFGYIIISLLQKKSFNNLKIAVIVLITFTFSVTVGVLWETVEFSLDRVFKTDGQRDEIVTNILSLELRKNKKTPKKLDHITKVIIYSNYGNKITKINGYLDIGIIDTMEDLIANLIGALLFSIMCLCYLGNKDKYRYLKIFFPITKEIKNEVL